MDKVRVFVSSTCYDLSQIRRDLEQFIINIGYEPVLSDSPNIAVPENLNKMEACQWLVRTSDIFVLIIGGRYGSTEEETGKSITWVEFETALSAKMPIYVFVDKEILLKRNVYNKLKDMVDTGTLSDSKMKEALGAKIEDPRVFELIKLIDTQGGGKWIHDFQAAEDIINKLKNSWSLEFKDLLSMRAEKLRRIELKDRNRPILRVSWMFENKTIDILELKLPKKYTPEELSTHYKKMVVPPDVLEKLEKNKDRIDVIFKNINYKKLGFPKKIDKADSLVNIVTEFNSQVKSVLEQIDKNFENLLCHIEASTRKKQPSFQISNDGFVPAQDVIVYIEIPELITIVETKDIPLIVRERTNTIDALIPFVSGIDDLYKEAIEIEKKPIAEPLSVLSKLLSQAPGPSFLGGANIRSSILGDFTSSTIPARRNVFLEDNFIRINLGASKLKHGFVYTESSELCFYASSFPRDSEIKLNYRCYADNLPIPDEGELKIVFTETK